MSSPAATLPVFRFSSLAPEHVDGVRHGITGRTTALPLDGDVSFSTGGDASRVFANRVRWSAAIGVDAARWTCARQVHGTRVHIVREGDAGRGSRTFVDALPETDILLTDVPGVPLAVFCADCTPILLVDPARGVIGAVHAGWRGTVRDAAGEAVRALARAFGTRPADILAAIGPAIGPCCYDVGAEVSQAWLALGLDLDGAAVVHDAGGVRLDLWEANRRCLEAAGVAPDRIELAGICVRCHADGYFSHRSGIVPEGRFAAVIALDGGATDARA